MSSLIFAHNDLDGLISAAIALKSLENKPKVIFSSNVSLKKNFFIALSKINDYNEIYFFDFGVREVLVKVSATLFKKVVWIDHHVNEKILQFQNVEYVLDEKSESAAKLVANYFNFYSDWIDVVNEVDTNNCKTQTSKIIRDYFTFIRIKYGKLYNRILSVKVKSILDTNPNDFINSEEVKSSLEEFQKIKEEYIKFLEESLEFVNLKDLKVAIIETKNSIPPYIVYEFVENKNNGTDLLVIVYRGFKGTKLEFRSFGKVDVQKIAKHFNGGGHKMASGAYLEDNLTKSQILTRIEEIL